MIGEGEEEEEKKKRVETRKKFIYLPHLWFQSWEIEFTFKAPVSNEAAEKKNKPLAINFENADDSTGFQFFIGATSLFLRICRKYKFVSKRFVRMKDFG